MKMLPRLFLGLAVLLQAIYAVSISASAEEFISGSYTYTVDNGEATIVKADESISGDVTIPSTLGGYSVTAIGSSAFACCNGLTGVVIPDGVTHIGSMAFNCCIGLNSVTIPGSAATIESNVFGGCTNLNSVTIQDGVTIISNEMFRRCTSLSSIFLPDSIATIGLFAFADCPGLVEITIPDGVTAILPYAFANCSSLIDISFPDRITCIDVCAFFGCSSLSQFSVPDSVTQIKTRAFEGCTSLESISIPASVTYISNDAFLGCGLTGGIHVASDNPGYSSDSQGVLYDKSKTKIITVPKGITSVTIPPSVTSIGDDAFYGCFGLTSITIPSGVTTLGTQAFSYCENLVSVTINAPITSIPTNCFLYCGKLKNVNIPATVTVIRTGAFARCEQLRSLVIPCSVQEMGNSVFAGMQGELTYEGWIRTSIDAFYEAQLTVYYPAGLYNKSGVEQDYAGGKVTWVAKNITWVDKNLSDVIVPSGEKATVTVWAVGPDLTYEWYYANAGSNRFVKSKSITGDTYSVTMNPSRGGRRIYCVVSGSDGRSYTTNTVTLGAALRIVDQSTDVTVKRGEKATVSIVAEGDGLTYQWYYANEDDSEYTYTSTFTTNTYSVTMTEARAGRRVYCIVRDMYGHWEWSNIVTLNMGTELKITRQPTSVTAQSGTTAKVTVGVQGDGLTYKWYYANAGKDSFTYTSSFGTNTYAVNMTAARAGRRVYCVITDHYGNSVTSDIVTISIA